jgi:hypothetical protein
MPLRKPGARTENFLRVEAVLNAPETYSSVSTKGRIKQTYGGEAQHPTATFRTTYMQKQRWHLVQQNVHRDKTAGTARNEHRDLLPSAGNWRFCRSSPNHSGLRAERNLGGVLNLGHCP